jgi:hypothetical protein
MENGTAPAEIISAIATGSLDLVKAWLDGGGDPNALTSSRRPTLLVAARWGRTRIMDLLLTRGADIDATDADGRTAVYELLNYWATYGSLPALKVLLSHGADVNKTKQSGFLVGQTPLMIAISAGPDYVRMLLRAGADPEHRAHDFGRSISTAEEQARSDPYCQRSASADLLRDVRLAGGWARYALQPHYDLLVLRALCHRRRATFDSWTPEVLVRLFGAPEARRRNNAVRGRTDLPDPLFWRILEFALGTAYDYPWVRERLRARSAALAAAE